MLQLKGHKMPKFSSAQNGGKYIKFIGE